MSGADRLSAALAELTAESDKADLPVVYFIGNDSSVKIGLSSVKKIASRLSDIQTGNHGKLALLAAAHGGASVERVLHLVFRETRLSGEWFAHSPELDRLIETLRSVPKPIGKNAAHVLASFLVSWNRDGLQAATEGLRVATVVPLADQPVSGPVDLGNFEVPSHYERSLVQKLTESIRDRRWASAKSACEELEYWQATSIIRLDRIRERKRRTKGGQR